MKHPALKSTNTSIIKYSLKHRELIDEVHSFMASVNSKRIDEIITWFSEDSSIWFPPADEVTGLRKIRLIFKLIFRKYRDIQWRILDVSPSSENRVWAVLYSWGTTDSGQPYENYVASYLKFKGKGEIINLSDFFKNMPWVECSK